MDAQVAPSEIKLIHWGVFTAGMCWGGSWTCCHITDPKNEGCLYDEITPSEFQMRCQQVTQHVSYLYTVQ